MSTKSNTPQESTLLPRLLRRPLVESRTGLSRSAIYDKIRCGEFPAPVSLGSCSVAWIEAEITAWIQARIDASRTAKAEGGYRHE